MWEPGCVRSALLSVPPAAGLAREGGDHRALARQSLALATTDLTRIRATELLANTALYQADYAEADRLLRACLAGYARLERPARLVAESLALRRQLRDRAGIAECLEVSAAVEQRAGRDAAGTRLLGAAHALRMRLDSARPDSDECAHAARVAALRTALGADAFDRAAHDPGVIRRVS